mgnify:CR=1 FL=1
MSLSGVVTVTIFVKPAEPRPRPSVLKGVALGPMQIAFG